MHDLENFINYCDNMKIVQEGFIKEHREIREGKKKLRSEMPNYSKMVKDILDNAKIPYTKISIDRPKKVERRLMKYGDRAGCTVKVFIDEKHSYKASNAIANGLDKNPTMRKRDWEVTPNNNNYKGYVSARFITTDHDQY